MARKKKITGSDPMNDYYEAKQYYADHSGDEKASGYLTESTGKVTGDDLMRDYYTSAGNSSKVTYRDRNADPNYAAQKAYNDRKYVLDNLEYFKNKSKNDMNSIVSKYQGNSDNKNSLGVNTIQSGIQEGQNRYFNEDSELPTSGRIIQTMDDRAIEEALKIAKGRMQQSDKAYTEKFGRSPEATTEHSKQAAQIDKYQNELDSRKTEREQNTYYKKREDALNALTDEQRSNLEEYVNATREMNNTSKISGAMGGTSMITENLQNEAINKKNAAKKALEDSGIKNLDVLAQYMGELQDEENTVRINDSIKKDVDKHPVLAGTAYSALDVAMSPAAGLTAAVETLKRPYYADPSAPVNTNSDAYALTNFSNATESAVSDKIDNKYGQFAYGVGMSTAKSAYSVALGSEIVGGLGLTGKAAKTVGNIVTLPEFCASAYATTLQQDQANGISTENSIKHATAAGINEMLFEVVSLDHAWDILHRSGKTAAKEAIVSTLAQAGIEGSEEGFTDIANAIADNIINGDQSEYNRNVQNYVSLGYTEQEAKDMASKDFMGEIAQDVLAGAISGGIMGGITNTANAVNYHKLGAHIETTTELKNNVLDVAEQMDESTTAKQIVEEKGRENLNAEDLGAIAQSMAEESGKDIQDVLTERFAELGETKQQARKDAKEIIKAVTTSSEEVTNEENDTRAQKFEANPNLSTVYAETLEGKHTAVNDAINNVQSSYHYAQMEKKGRESHTGVTRAVVKSTGEKQIVIDVQNVSGNHATVRMSNGTLKDLSEIEIPDRNLQQLYNFSTTMDTATVANALINNWDNEEVAPYVRASAVFYNAGKLGTSSFESLMNNPKNAQLVMSVNNPATLKAMYTLGQNNSQRAEVAPVQQQKNVNGSEQKAKAGKVVDLRTDKADGRMVQVAEHVAKKTGLEITLNDSLEHGENGHFSQALSRIALSSTSHNEYETLIHELNEWANTYNPEGMRKVMDAVLDYAQTKEGATYLSDRIQQYYDTYKRVEADKTYEGSADEFVFDYLAGVFSTEEGVKDFSHYMTEENISQKEQKSILETVADFFKELYDKIVSFLDDHVLSETAKKGLEADAKKAQEIRDMVLGVWSKAEENFGNNADPENDMKFSINVDLDEELKKYNIENKLNDYIAVQKAVVNHLKETGFFDKNSTVVNEETGMQIRINPRGIKETLSNGKRFQTLPKELKKLKIATIEKLPEIIQQGILLDDNVENLHGNNETFAYFETLVNINGDNYRVKVDVKKSIETNKFWMHNVLLKKDSELDPATTQDYDKSRNLSKKNVTSTVQNVNKKYSLNVDSDGKELSDGQKNYFKNSKVVDKDGNLLVMYHGTPRGEFTVFKPGLQFFTQNKEYADKYQEPSASSRTAGKQVTNQKTYEVYLNITKPFDIRDPKIKKTFIEDYVKGGYALGINPYVPYKDTTSTGLPSWEEADNIYEFLEDNDFLDEYDGIVVDEGGYEGENGKTMYRGISYITFNSNQVKNVDNLNPTENNDIRYSIDIDDSFFDALYSEPSEHETEMSSIIQEGFESLKKVEVNERMMRKIAYAIKKENKSTYDIDKLTSNLTKVFAYLKEHQNADYNDMIRIVQEVAKPVIEESTDVDPYEQQAYKDVRDYVKGLDIRLNDEQKAEVAYYYGSYEKFRKMNFGNFNFTDKGTYLDNLWTEIVDNSYQMLDYDVSSADQPMALVDMLNQLKLAKKNIFGMDKEQAAYDLALDIYRRFFVEQAQDAANKKVYEKTDRLIVRQQEYRKRVKAAYDESLAKLRTAETEKRKQQAERYEEKIADLKSAQQAALANADKKAAKKYQDDIVSWNRWLTRATQRADRTEQRMLELKAATRNNALAKRRNQEMSSMRERIKKNANGIISYFNTNTDKKHVPEALKDSVAKFITSIDFVSERANLDSNATMAWRESLNQMYRKLSDRNAAVEGNYEDIFNALMDQADGNKSTLLSDMSDFINANENVRITDMNANQLKQLDELITRLKRTITTVNQLYVNKRTNDARKLGADTIAELEQKKDKKLHANRTVQAVENLLDVNMMDARSYFYRLGDTAGSIYDALRTAFNDRVWLLKEAQTYMENALEGINTKDWTGDSAKVHTFMIRGKELQMTTAQIMSLYELRKRNQALLHMKVGGIRPKDITTAKKNVDISKNKIGKEVISRVKPIQLTEYDIDHVICSVLTPEQIKIADAMQQFMANNCADWGNKTTMMMNGYKRFGVKSYFPIKVDGNSVDTKDQTAYWATQNNSFTKQTRERAANALIVDDIFDVFTKHVTDMATYSTFTAPLSDAMKWFNHRNVEFDGDIAADTDSVQRQIELTYGKEYLEYFKKLIKDINAESVNGIESQIASTLVSKMKAASVGGNLRVAIQQPTAYIRAAAIMNPKYMAQAVFKKSAMKKAKENSAITQWKSWGYFETSIGQSMKSVITGQQSLKENIVEKSMILAQLGDDVTWGYLWNACEAEIKDKHPDVKYDSKEFIKMVADRFDEIVDQTQVVDSVLHRSQIMRSQDKLVQMATAFMAEPTKSYNLLVNAVRDASEKKSKSSIKRLGRVVTAYTATQVMNAAIVAVIDAARDLEDDDKTFWDKYIENLKGNIVDNMNPISMIPFAKDIVSIFQGYDISRLDMQGISKLYAGANNMRKYITDPDYREKHTFYDVAKETARGVSLVTGIPGFNVLRDIESLYHAVTGKWMGGIIRSNTRQYQRSVDALLDGNTEEYDSIMQELAEKNVEEDKIDSGIMSELKKRYTAGEIEKSTVENILKDQFEMDDNDIYYKLKKWENGSDWTKYSDFYSAMDNAYETGKINDRDKIKAEIDDLKKHGVKEENIKSQITEKYKPIYLEAKKKGNYADLKNLLISAYMMCGDSHSEAMKKIDNWSKQKKS